MGIPGLVSVIGPGERVSLSTFAVHFLQDKKRPIRIAIDISIWLFQIQASKGGLNPELRTLLFRLTRLTSLPIHPLFVYDGKDRPHLKRGKVVRGTSGGILERQSQRLLDAFNLPWHRAPGEAEAECSLLQRAGIVDAVMTEDIDAVMFGSEVTLLNFSKEASGSAAATHVSVYRTRSENGHPPNVQMDRQAMILFALLSGGDYIPAGVPKCGTKLAGEIVAAGFGKRLMAIFRSDGEDQESKLAEWRQQLEDELHTNSSGFFKTKHKAITIPKTFPDKRVLLAYAIPVVSNISELRALREATTWSHVIDAEKVRTFTQEVLGWELASGSMTLTNLLGPPLLTQRMLLQRPLFTLLDHDEDTNVPIICNEKKASDDDGYDEVRVEFLPVKVVGFTINEQKIPETEKNASNTSNDGEHLEETINDEAAPSQSTNQQVRTVSFDPKQRKRIWVPQLLAELGMTDIMQEYRTKQAAKQEAQRKAAEEKVLRSEARKAKKYAKKVLDPSMKEGSILKYTRVIKSGTMAMHKSPSKKPESSVAPRNSVLSSSQTDSFSGSSIFNSSQDPINATQTSDQQDGPITDYTSQKKPLKTSEQSSRDGPHTSDIEAAFDSDYNYEGLKNELAERESSLRRGSGKSKRASKREKKSKLQGSEVAVSRQQEPKSQPPALSKSSKRTTSTSCDEIEEDEVQTIECSMQQQSGMSEEESIIQAMKDLTVIPEAYTNNEDIALQMEGLRLSSKTSKTQKQPARSQRIFQPHEVFQRQKPKKTSSVSGVNRPRAVSNDGAVTKGNDLEPARRRGAEKDIIEIFSDSDESELPCSKSQSTALRDNSFKSKTGAIVNSGSKSINKLSRQVQPPDDGNAHGNSSTEQLEANSHTETQQTDPLRIADDSDVIIETFNGYWRYRRTGTNVHSMKVRRSNRRDTGAWQSGHQIWQGAVKTLDLTQE